jgi:hypothetical protein
VRIDSKGTTTAYEDPGASEAVNEIAEILAKGYLRYREKQREQRAEPPPAVREPSASLRELQRA